MFGGAGVMGRGARGGMKGGGGSVGRGVAGGERKKETGPLLGHGGARQGVWCGVWYGLRGDGNRAAAGSWGARQWL